MLTCGMKRYEPQRLLYGWGVLDTQNDETLSESKTGSQAGAFAYSELLNNLEGMGRSASGAARTSVGL